MRVFILIFFTICCLLAPIRPVAASTYVDIEDDRVYFLLSRLEAEGVIEDALLSTRPLSRKEVVRLVREAEKNAEGREEFIRSLVRELKERIRPEEFEAGGIKPIDSASVKYVHTNADVLTLAYPGATREKEQAFNYNNDGDLYGRGSNFRIGFVSRAEDLGPFSFYLNPEERSSPDHEQGTLRKGYGVLGFSWIDIVAGKDSQWWGPGYNGANLLSNNAEPLTMVKLTAPGPVRLPWIFQYLGPFQYTLFVARLENDRGDFSEPYFDGLRLDFKPVPYLEIGLERVTLLGGRGRPLSNGQWIRSFLGTSGHPSSTSSDYTDTEAGGDVKLTLPFRVQPLQVYWQRDGEDSRQRRFGFPYKFADLYGLYLPRLLEFENIGLRAEYAVNHVSGWPDIWYTHSNYTSGVTYHGMIIGHHMGTDANDLFLELSCRLPEAQTQLFLSYDKERHNMSGAVQEQTEGIKLTAEFPIVQRLDVTAVYGYGRIENPGNLPGPVQYVTEISAEARYRF